MVFMDGHSTHINIAVTEFCIQHKIILRCFPAHASHILQPLDVAVFGPLKKSWNQAIENHKDQYNQAMTKHSFFSVFDLAWKDCKEKKHITAGFKSSGLVPFNPDNVHYDKLLQRKGNLDTKNKNLLELSGGQRLGINIAFIEFEKVLSEDQKRLFEKRFNENYDISGTNPENQLYQYYARLRQMMASTSLDLASHPSSSSDESQSVPSVESQSIPSIESQSVPSASVESSEASQAIHETLPDVVSVSSSNQTPRKCNEGASTSTAALDTSYENWKESPFKKYLKIKVPLYESHKKCTKSKSKVPPAISGIDYLESLKMVEERKIIEWKKKEERKQERERKRLEKMEAKQKKKRVASSDEDSEGEIVYASSDEDVDEGSDKCGACEGDEDWDIPGKWIGCIKCVFWYHRACLSQEIENMSAAEIKAFQFCLSNLYFKRKQSL